MIKMYCDICGREVKKEEPIWLRFFKPHGKSEEFNKTTPEMDICPECHKKVTTSKAPEVTAPILKQAKKIVKDAVKETPKKEKPKKEEKKKIDKGKIWALSHGKNPWSFKEIAEEMGCSPLTVAEYIRQMKKERGEE